MKFVLIVVWFSLPPQQRHADFSNIAAQQPLGVAMQEFDDQDACEAEAKRLAGPYIDARCSPKGPAASLSSADPANPTERGPFADDLASRGR